MKISYLLSGGLITNYNCTSKCKHCLYACSPTRSKEYIDTTTTRNILKKVKSLGCSSLHIGGGEPMLNIEKLKEVLKIAREEGIHIEYVETNSSWYTKEETVVKKLNELKSCGLTTLLISISPFHNEFIPFDKVKGVLSACSKVGISIFAWIQDFYLEINTFNGNITHNLEEYKALFGEDYVMKIPQRYWTHLGGRAVYTYKDIFPLQSLDSIIGQSSGCSELTDTSHFHFDLDRNYIPGLCSGFAIRVENLGKELKEEMYPFINILHSKGIESFLNYAIKSYNFRPAKEYLNKCHLCNEIRKFMVIEKRIYSIELAPKEYYSNI